MWNATIVAEELSYISSCQTLWGDKNWKLLSNCEAQFISLRIFAPLVVKLWSGWNLEWRHNNQPTFGVCGSRDVWEVARPVWSAGGGALYHQFWQQFEWYNLSKISNTLALRGHQLPRTHTATTNQKEAESIDGSRDRRCEQRGASRAVSAVSPLINLGTQHDGRSARAWMKRV